MSYDNEGRVTEQKAPVGRKGKEKTIFTFDYKPKDHRTEVHDAKGRKTVYRYSSRERLTHIEKFRTVLPKGSKAKREFYREQEFFWGKRETTHRGDRDDSDEGHLLGKALYDSDRKAHVSEQYEYDAHGNITEETLYGNLSGGGKRRFEVSDDGRPEHHHEVEHYSKKYSYSHDNFHLKTCQREDSGPKIEYEYQKDSDLLISKLTYEGDRIRVREFFEYDSDAVLVKKIIDNGSSPHATHLTDVTERHITSIKPVHDRDDHGVGQPARIIECYLDMPSKEERQLKRTEYTYTKAGLVKSEAVYDSQDQLRYTLYNEYDSKNRLIRKTDAAGREYLFEYDHNFNKTREELVSSGLFTTFDYDKADNLIQKTDHHADGLTLSTSYTYDTVGNLRSTIDIFGQKSTKFYDDLNRVIGITQPSVVDRNGNVYIPTVRNEHDLFDNIAVQTDQNGHAVTTRFTVRNMPAQITYPDGSSERFEYNLNGTLAKKWERNGSRKEFSYDIFKRVLSTTVFDANGALLTTISNTYDSFHCTSTTDPMGTTTFFQYDGAGRLSRIQKKTSVTEYGYDSLGRRERTTESVADGQYIDTIEIHDLLDRMIERRKTHSDGTLLSLQRFSYDIRGNCTDVTTFTSPETSTTVHTDFSTRDLPVRVIDALGNCTEISYDYGWKNELNQSVLRKVTKDPLGNQTIEISDALSRLDTLEKRSSDGALLAKTVFRYDGTGNKTQEKEFVVVGGVPIREYVIEWSYTPMDLCQLLVEQPRTPDEKTTSYTYTQAGQLEKISKPFWWRWRNVRNRSCWWTRFPADGY